MHPTTRSRARRPRDAAHTHTILHAHQCFMSLVSMQYLCCTRDGAWHSCTDQFCASNSPRLSHPRTARRRARARKQQHTAAQLAPRLSFPLSTHQKSSNEASRRPRAAHGRPPRVLTWQHVFHMTSLKTSLMISLKPSLTTSLTKAQTKALVTQMLQTYARSIALRYYVSD